MTHVLCECKGFDFRQTCKHAKTVERLLATGATFAEKEFLITSHTDPRRKYTIQIIP